MTTKMVPKSPDNGVTTIHHQDGSMSNRNSDNTFDIDDKNVREAEQLHGLVKQDDRAPKKSRDDAPLGPMPPIAGAPAATAYGDRRASFRWRASCCSGGGTQRRAGSGRSDHARGGTKGGPSGA